MLTETHDAQVGRLIVLSITIDVMGDFVWLQFAIKHLFCYNAMFHRVAALISQMMSVTNVHIDVAIWSNTSPATPIGVFCAEAM